MTTSSSTKRLTNLAIAFCAAAGVARADWPFARGGVDSTGAAAFALPDEPSVLWRYESGGSPFEATPVVAGGVAYLGDADGTLHAVRIDDGQLVWKRSFGETFLLSPAAVAGDSVAVADADGVVRCLATADGAERWSFNAAAEAYGGPLVHRTGEGAELLLVPTEAGLLYALDLATGEELWSFEIEAPLRCTPTLADGHTMLAGCDGKLHVLEVASGEAVGSCDIGDPTGNTAALRGSTVYFGTEGGQFYAIDARDPTETAIGWTHRDPKRAQGVRTAAAVSDEVVVYVNQAKTVYALDRATGEARWTARTRSGVDASPLLLADGRVLIATSRGRVRLLDAATGKAVWTNDAGGGFKASPAAADGRVLLANTDGTLTCLGEE